MKKFEEYRETCSMFSEELHTDEGVFFYMSNLDSDGIHIVVFKYDGNESADFVREDVFKPERNDLLLISKYGSNTMAIPAIKIIDMILGYHNIVKEVVSGEGANYTFIRTKSFDFN